jgi:hypothetical protein
MAEAPDDLDRPLDLVVFEVGGAEIREGKRRGVGLPYVGGSGAPPIFWGCLPINREYEQRAWLMREEHSSMGFL